MLGYWCSSYRIIAIIFGVSFMRICQIYYELNNFSTEETNLKQKNSRGYRYTDTR